MRRKRRGTFVVELSINCSLAELSNDLHPKIFLKLLVLMKGTEKISVKYLNKECIDKKWINTTVKVLVSLN